MRASLFPLMRLGIGSSRRGNPTRAFVLKFNELSEITHAAHPGHAVSYEDEWRIGTFWRL